MIRNPSHVNVSLISSSFHSHKPNITMAGMATELPLRNITTCTRLLHFSKYSLTCRPNISHDAVVVLPGGPVCKSCHRIVVTVPPQQWEYAR